MRDIFLLFGVVNTIFSMSETWYLYSGFWVGCALVLAIAGLKGEPSIVKEALAETLAKNKAEDA